MKHKTQFTAVGGPDSTIDLLIKNLNALRGQRGVTIFCVIGAPAAAENLCVFFPDAAPAIATGVSAISAFADSLRDGSHDTARAIFAAQTGLKPS